MVAVNHLTAEEELDLIRRSQAGDLASRNYLIQRNYGYILSEATRFSRIYSQYRREDVIGQISLAYIRAIEKFDCNRGLRLSTYATYCIRNSMRRTLATDSFLIRIPASALSGQGTKRIQDAVERIKNGITTISRPAFSRDHSGDQTNDHAEDTIPERPAVNVEYSEQQMHVERVKKTLSARMQSIVEMRSRGQSFQEIGRITGVSKQRAGQIYMDALTRIKKKLREQGLLTPNSQGATHADSVSDCSGAANPPESL